MPQQLIAQFRDVGRVHQVLQKSDAQKNHGIPRYVTQVRGLGVFGLPLQIFLIEFCLESYRQVAKPGAGQLSILKTLKYVHQDGRLQYPPRKAGELRPEPLIQWSLSRAYFCQQFSLRFGR